MHSEEENSRRVFQAAGWMWVIYLAAQAIIDSIKGNSGPASAAARYRRESEQHIRKDLWVALRLARLIDRYPGIFLRIFFDHPRALERYLDIVGGRADYRHFQQWLLPRIPWYLLSSIFFKFGKRHQAS